MLKLSVLRELWYPVSLSLSLFCIYRMKQDILYIFSLEMKDVPEIPSTLK
jgi:hypothetical protein